MAVLYPFSRHLLGFSRIFPMWLVSSSRVGIRLRDLAEAAYAGEKGRGALAAVARQAGW